MMYYITTVSQK